MRGDSNCIGGEAGQLGGQANSGELPEIWVPHHNFDSLTLTFLNVLFIVCAVVCAYLRFALVRSCFCRFCFRYFIQGYEPQYWWWDILIKRADIGAMMVITYTSIALGSRIKCQLTKALQRGCTAHTLEKLTSRKEM